MNLKRDFKIESIRAGYRSDTLIKYSLFELEFN